MTVIGIIGAGNVGAALARRLTAVGHEVLIANSRGPQTLAQIARDTGAKAVDLQDAFCQVEMTVLAIPFGKIPRLRTTWQRCATPPGTVIDASNYVPRRDGQITDIDAGMPETAWMSAQLGIPLVKTFNSITAHSLATRGAPRAAARRVALPVAADNPSSKVSVLRLVDELGFDPFDAGKLFESWRQQPGQPAYCPDPTLLELRRLLDRADRRSGPINRERALNLMAKLPANFPARELVHISRLAVGLDTWQPRSWLAALRLAGALLLPRPRNS